MTDRPLPDWSRLDDAALGEHLRPLADTIEPHGIDLVAAVRASLDESTPPAPGRTRRPLAVAAVVFILAGVLVLAVAPARTAVAGWLGLGSTSVEIVEELPLAEPAAPPQTPPEGQRADYETIRGAALTQLGLAVLLPDESLIGEPAGWEVRGTGATKELVVSWDGITMTARDAATAASIRKFVTTGDVVSADLTTDGEPALWIEGRHVRDTGESVESTGNTLLWIAADVEYRLFGELDRAEAVELASSLG
jgi:hypothetical protein